MCPSWKCQFVIVMVLVLGGIARAAIGDDVSGEQVQQLVEQLGASSLSVRGEAERALRNLGPGVLPHLPAPELLRSAASRDAVLRIREVLERQQAEATAQASHVTLRGTFPLREIVESISEQTGNAVDPSGLSQETLNKKLKIDWTPATFWESIRQIESEAELFAQPDAEGKQLNLVAPPCDDSLRWIVDTGAFRIVCQSFSRRRDFTDESREILRVDFEVLAEPRLRPLFIRMNHADFRLTGADDSLQPLNAEARLERPVKRGAATPLTIDFVTSKGSEISDIDFFGKLTVELAAGTEEFVFRNLGRSEHVIRRRGGVTVTMDQVRFSSAGNSLPRSCRVDLRVAYDAGGPAFESHRTWVFHNEAHLKTMGGEYQWAPDGFDTVAGAEAAVKLSYRFREITAQPSELEFVYTAPTLVVTLPVDFEVVGISEPSTTVN